MFVDERAIIEQLRWVLWSQRARSRSTRYLQISRWQFGADSSIILQFIALRVKRVEMVRLFCSQPFSLVDGTYHCKTQQNATLTGQEEEGDVQLKYLSFVLLYFDFWTILVHGSFDDSSHFVHVNINILTHATSGPPVILTGYPLTLDFFHFVNRHLRYSARFDLHFWRDVLKNIDTETFFRAN